MLHDSLLEEQFYPENKLRLLYFTCVLEKVLIYINSCYRERGKISDAKEIHLIEGHANYELNCFSLHINKLKSNMQMQGQFLTFLCRLENI
jgi:hypothetical protein